MESIFIFRVGEPPNVSTMVSNLTNQKDFYDYLRQSAGKDIKIVLSRRAKLSEKQQMFDYYHKVILSVAISVFSEEGWESMDKLKADHFLKQECAKGLVYNIKQDREVIYFEEKAKMNKDRLHKFITDCIIFLEIEKGARVPDSDSYKISQSTGIEGFKKIR